MKTLHCLLLTLLFHFPLFPQQLLISGGGAGHFSLGPALLLNPSLTDYLQRPEVAGSQYTGSPLAVQIGGEGYAMINKFVIGGGGFALNGVEEQSAHAGINLNGAGGYFKAGYRFWSRQTAFMTACTGLGVIRYDLELENLSAENGIAFRQNNPLMVGDKEKYHYTAMLLDVSAGLKQMVIGSRNEQGFGGFLIGLDLGSYLNVPVLSEWKMEGEKIEGPPSPGFSAIPYIRLTIGGGGFGYR